MKAVASGIAAIVADYIRVVAILAMRPVALAGGAYLRIPTTLSVEREAAIASFPWVTPMLLATATAAHELRAPCRHLNELVAGVAFI